MKELPKHYEPQKTEDDIYKMWEVSGLFNPDTCIERGVVDNDADTFSIVLPPPNVTGTLHMDTLPCLQLRTLSYDSIACKARELFGFRAQIMLLLQHKVK